MASAGSTICCNLAPCAFVPFLDEDLVPFLPRELRRAARRERHFRTHANTREKRNPAAPNPSSTGEEAAAKEKGGGASGGCGGSGGGGGGRGGALGGGKGGLNGGGGSRGGAGGFAGCGGSGGDGGGGVGGGDGGSGGGEGGAEGGIPVQKIRVERAAVSSLSFSLSGVVQSFLSKPPVSSLYGLRQK